VYGIKVIRNGTELKKIRSAAFLEYITPLIKERSFIALDRIPTMAEEKKWVESSANEIDEGNRLMIILFHNKKIAGICEASRGKYKERYNVSFALSIAKEHRGKGYGGLLLRKAIQLAKKKFRPHKLWIEYMEGNNIAKNLYEKIGFVEVCRLSERLYHFGRWKDLVIMEYKGD